MGKVVRLKQRGGLRFLGKQISSPDKDSPCGLHQAPNSAAKNPPFIAESHGIFSEACRDQVRDGRY